MRSSAVTSLLIITCVALGCAGAPEPESTGYALTPDEISAEVLAAMDLDADPCQDFYRYACGSWLDATELPADQPRWTRSFSVIRERNRRELLGGRFPDQIGRFV